MTRKKEQARMRELLTEALSVLCKASLTYQHEFSIEGLVGITVDNEEIFLVNINECVQKKAAAYDRSKAEAVDVSPGKRKCASPAAEAELGLSAPQQEPNKKRPRRRSADFDPDVEVKVERDTEERLVETVDSCHGDAKDSYDAGTDDVNGYDVKPGCSSWVQSQESSKLELEDSSEDCIAVKTEPPDPLEDCNYGHPALSDLIGAQDASPPWTPGQDNSPGRPQSLATVDSHRRPGVGLGFWEMLQIGPARPNPGQMGRVDLNPPRFTCPICGAKYRYKYDLHRHLQIHEAKQYPCPICGKNFALPRYVQQHLVLVHEARGTSAEQIRQLAHR